MMRPLKLLAVVLLLLAVGVFVVAVSFLNPILERAKPSIERTISKTIQAPVKLGPVKVSALPSPRISVADLKVGEGAEGFTLGRLTLNCELLPLLKGMLQVKKIDLSSATFAVTKNSQGKILIGGVDLSKLQDPNAGTKQSVEEATGSKLDLAVREVEMERIDITYKDATRSPPIDISATNLALTAKGLSALGADSFRITGALLNPDHQNFALTGSVQLDQLTRLPNGDLNFVLQAFDLGPVAPILSSFAPEIKNRLTVTGPLDGSLKIKMAGVKYDYEIKVRATKSEIVLSDTFVKKAGTEFGLDAAGNAIVTGFINLTSSEIQIGDSRFSGTFSDLEKKSLPKSLGINFEIPNLNQFAQALPAATKFSPTGKLSGTLQLTKKEAILAIVSGDISGSDLSLSTAEKLQFDNGTLALKLSPDNIKISDISLQRGNETMKFEGDVSPSALANVARVVALRSSEFLGGKIDLDAKFNPHEKLLKAKLSAGGIPLERATGVTGSGDALGITGTIDVLAVESSVKVGEDKAGLSANGNISVINGKILKFNLFADIIKALNKLPILGFQGEDLPGADSVLKDNGTAFDSLKLSTKVNGDDIIIDSLTLAHQLYSLSGKGNINVNGPAKITCDVSLPAGFAEKITAKSEKFRLGLNSDGSLSVPVVIMRLDATSPWLVLPDVKKLGEKILKGAGRDVVKEKGSKILDKVSPGLGSAVKSLF